MSVNDATPPGREEQVQALKEQPGVDNPYAVAWASYNKSTDDAPHPMVECDDCGRLVPLSADGMHVEAHESGRGTMCERHGRPWDKLGRPVYDVIQKRGSEYVLLSRKTGKVLGHHKTREEAEAQERAVQASKHAGDEGAGMKHADGAVARRVRRLDYADLAPPEKMANGFLRVHGRISRIGIQVYQDPGGGEHRELRLPEDVFDPESIASFRGMPTTNMHPPELLDARSAKHYATGAVSTEPQREGDFLVAEMTVFDEEQIKYLEAGRVELSCGYTCELDPTPGEWRGQKYDSIQRKIRGNHVAFVDAARAGAEARVRMDGWAGDCDSITTNGQETRMAAKIKIGDLQLELTEGNAPAIERAAEKLSEKAEAETKRADAAEKRLALIKARHEARKDAFKAYKHDLMNCPACGGEGKMAKHDVDPDGDGDEHEECDYCDGAGKVSALGAFGGEVKTGDDDDDDASMDDDAMDVNELEVEQATEEESKAAHKDAAARDKRRQDGVKKLVAAVERRARRDSLRRAKLETEARKHLGAEADLSKMDDLAVRRAVIEKLAPSAKLDGRDATYVRARFDAEIERLSSDENAADRARRAAAPAMPRAAERADADSARARMLERQKDAWKTPKKENA